MSSFQRADKLEKNPSKKERELSVWGTHVLHSAKGKENAGYFFSELQKSFGIHEAIQL